MTDRHTKTLSSWRRSVVVMRWFTVIAGTFAILALSFTLGAYFERFRSNSNYIAEQYNKVQVESAAEQSYEQIHQSVLKLFNRDYASMIADYGDDFRNYECRGDYFYDYDYTGTPLAFGYRSIRPSADERPQTIKLYRIKEGETYYGISSDCLPSDVIDYLGEPVQKNYDELNGRYYLYYNMQHYKLLFEFDDEDAVDPRLIFMKK